MSDLFPADALGVGDRIDRYGTVRTVKRVSIGASGNVEVDWTDGTIEDLDPSAYLSIAPQASR